jgi:hypothetical protein
MIYRQLDSNGDYTFGVGGSNFLVNNPQAIAQAVKTRLGLAQGEWFLDTTLGVPFDTQILGAGKKATFNAAIQQAILDTPGVLAITAYSSSIDPNTRKATVTATITTVYGLITIKQTFGGKTVAGQLLDINFILDQSALG